MIQLLNLRKEREIMKYVTIRVKEKVRDLLQSEVNRLNTGKGTRDKRATIAGLVEKAANEYREVSDGTK